MKNGKDKKKRSEMLANEGVGKLLSKLSMPSIVAMMVQALYNVVDTIFVGKGVGFLGIGGITIVFPILMIIMAVGQFMGIGGASLISRRMGANDPEGAGFAFGNMMLLSLIVSLGSVIIGWMAMDLLLGLAGATGDILPYAREYFQIIIFGIPLMTFSMAGNDAVRAEGNATFAMMAMMLGAALNIVLDYIFIFILDMGIQGAAMATVISMLVTSLFLLGYYFGGWSEVPVGFKSFRLKWHIVWEILTVGSPTLVMTFAFSFTVILVNNTLRAMGGAVEIAAFGVIHRMLSFIFMPVMGLTQGMQPIVGFNYGARQYTRVRQGIRLTGIASTVVSSMGFVVVLAFPESIMKIFSNDLTLVEVGKDALTYCILALPLVGFQVMGGGLFQALGKPIPALILSLSRQVLILIPIIAILPRFLGIKGVWLSFPVADTLSFFLALAFILWAMKKFLPATENTQAPVKARHSSKPVFAQCKI